MQSIVTSTETFSGMDGYCWERQSIQCIRGAMAPAKEVFEVSFDRRKRDEMLSSLDLDSLSQKARAIKARRLG